ncbi:MAG TPA: hypothetical protein PK264_08305, partial [Hyphomicrobiaceae bacterium]|nr:hypothetical protein [Hyphomicrobiaceae bacterium]
VEPVRALLADADRLRRDVERADVALARVTEQFEAARLALDEARAQSEEAERRRTACEADVARFEPQWADASRLDMRVAAAAAELAG